MAKKKVVVNQAYFELVERKARLLDSIFEDDYGGCAVISIETLKERTRIQTAWLKIDADSIAGTETPYKQEK